MWSLEMVRQDKEQTLKRKEKNKSSVSLSSCKCKSTFQGQWVHLFMLKRLSGLRQAQTSHYRCGQNKHDKKTASSYLCCHYAVPHIQHVNEKIYREALPKWCNAAPWQCLNINKGSDRWDVSLMLHQAVKYYSQYSSHHIRNHSDTVNLN